MGITAPKVTFSDAVAFNRPFSFERPEACESPQTMALRLLSANPQVLLICRNRLNGICLHRRIPRPHQQSHGDRRRTGLAGETARSASLCVGLESVEPRTS